MFWNKKCKRCNEAVKSDWNFCPECGKTLMEDNVDDVFQDVERELQKIDKSFKGDLDFNKFKRHPKASGINITITSGTGMPPRVEVRTSGAFRKVEPEIRQRLGVKVPDGGGESRPEKEFRVPKITEEPETKISRAGNKQIIRIHLPDVKEEDVQIRQLEQSIEIKAYVGDKAYFKLIPIPTNAHIGKEFKDGVLKLEVFNVK